MMNEVFGMESTSAPLDLPVVKRDKEKTISSKVGSEQVSWLAGGGGVKDACVPETISGWWWKC